MPQVSPIGRERELEELLGFARRTVAGQGNVVFLAGPRGSGKSVLLTALREGVEATPELDDVESVKALCYDPNNSLGPFGEIVRALTTADRRRTRARKVLEVVREIAPPLVELIPVIGKLAGTGVKVASTVGVYALGGSSEAEQHQLASDIAESLLKVADDAAPLLLVIDDAQWIDAASCEVVRRLAPAVETHPLLLVLAYDLELVPDAHPLARTRSALAIQPLKLDDLRLDAVAALLRDRYGGDLHPNLAPWLLDVSEGNLLFVDQHLRALEQCGAIQQADGGYLLNGAIDGSAGDWRLSGAVSEAGTPETLLDLLRPRVADLEDDDRTLLESGSVQGQRFFSTVLVDLLQKDENEVLDRLQRIQEQRRLIASEQSEGWWTDRSELYAFDPGALRELLYTRYAQSPYQRRRRHAEVAEALERLLEGDANPPRQALLQIATHYEEARRPLPAARRLFEAAESTYEEGARLDTVRHCERGLALLRSVGDEERDTGLLAHTIVLYLVASQSRWSGDEERGGAEFLELADEASRAAEATGDLALQAQAHYARGNVLVTFDSLERAVEAFREARRLAHEAGDPVGEFSILLALGHHLDSVDLKAGRNVLREAHTLVTSGALEKGAAPRQIELAQARLEMRIGVAEFDLGDYGEAYRLLPGAVERLRAGRDLEETAWGLSFLGQLYTALGLFEAAEAALRDGIGLFGAGEEVIAVRGYLRALLGRLYVEWDPPRLDAAGSMLETGRAETDRNRTVRPLTDLYHAELLLARGDRASLEAADELLAGTREVSDATGWARSAIGARSLGARVALALGRPADALRLSTEAVDLLQGRGGAVPAVRTEEIYHAHARVLEAAGSSENEAWLRKAAEVVRGKAESIADPARRASFLERARLSREILAAEAEASR